MDESTIGSRVKRAWNAFLNKDPTSNIRYIEGGSASKPDRRRSTGRNERSIVTAVYNRIAMDVAAIRIRHVRLDDDEQYIETIDSGLNNCLTLEANIDQTGRELIQDTVHSMLEEGVIALVPVDTDVDPTDTEAFKILTMRTGRVIQWYPTSVRLEVYNERVGKRQEIVLPKKMVSIIQNPLYSVMNEPNSTLQRLIRKLNLLDVIDEQSGAGKLDLIIQLPYVIKTEARRQQAEIRRQDIEKQLSGSKYGIAYTDGTEHITQLNRPAENNLMKQIEFLTSMLYSQLGITQTIMDGTADEKTMLNYFDRTIEPILSAIVDEMRRKFLTKTARTQGQSIEFYRDPFKLVPVSQLAEIADKFTRNEIMSSNEFRQVIGMKPSKDPKADRLENSNIAHPEQPQMIDGMAPEQDVEDELTEEDRIEMNSDLDVIDEEIAKLEAELEDDELKHYASPYYDPVKAHEYYMKNRELKGRRSTAGLNDAGKNAAKYVREQLNNEKKEKINASRENMKSGIESSSASTKSKISSSSEKTNAKIASKREEMKATIATHKTEMNSKITTLRNFLKGMSKEQRAAQKEMIQQQIDELKAANAKTREELQSQFKADSTDLRESHKSKSSSLRESHRSKSENLRNEHKENSASLKDEYNKKYEKELDKIKNTASFKKVSKRRRRS